jgi:DNA-binding NtrC family response regulator
MRQRVLLVEDEPILRLTLANDLAEEGYEVSAARDGAEGAEQIATRRFDAVLLDLKLPKVDGLSLLKQYKAATPQGIAVLMTAYGTIQSAVAAMKAGAADYLLKPFASEELLVLLRGLLAARGALSAEPSGPDGVRGFGDLLRQHDDGPHLRPHRDGGQERCHGPDLRGDGDRKGTGRPGPA